MASRAPRNQAHVPIYRVYLYNLINWSCTGQKKEKIICNPANQYFIEHFLLIIQQVSKIYRLAWSIYFQSRWTKDTKKFINIFDILWQNMVRFQCKWYEMLSSLSSFELFLEEDWAKDWHTKRKRDMSGIDKILSKSGQKHIFCWISCRCVNAMMSLFLIWRTKLKIFHQNMKDSFQHRNKMLGIFSRYPLEYFLDISTVVGIVIYYLSFFHC